MLFPVLHRETETLGAYETWLRSHTASRWQGEDSNPGGRGPGPILTGICLVVKARNLTLY